LKTLVNHKCDKYVDPRKVFKDDNSLIINISSRVWVTWLLNVWCGQGTWSCNRPF